MLGGVFSLVILLPEINFFLSLFMKLVAAAIMVLVSYKTESVQDFFRCFLCFFSANFIFAGVMLAVELGINPNSMIYQNGSVYFDIDIVTLVVLTVVCYIIIFAVMKIIKPKVPDKSLCRATIEVDGKICGGEALADTGNSLSDGFSGNPVIIAELKTVKPLIPEKQLAFFENCNINADCGGIWEKRIRLIPYRALGYDGVLPAFRPDSVTVSVGSKEKRSTEVLVGVSSKPLSGGEYSIIINSELL